MRLMLSFDQSSLVVVFRGFSFIFYAVVVVGALVASSLCNWLFVLILLYIYSAILLPSFRKKTLQPPCRGFEFSGQCVKGTGGN